MSAARIFEWDHFWVAWTFTTGWPRRLFRARFKPNEHSWRVWHIGAVGFGYSFEFRFGWER